MDDATVARWRMHTVRLTDHTLSTPADVVGGLLAVQAENHAQASWAVATRASGEITEAEFGDLFDDGVILRTHVLRSTWHFVCPDDIRWLVELTAPRVLPAFDQVRQSLGLEDAVVEKSVAVVVETLSDGPPLTRESLGERLRQVGLPGEGQALGVIAGTAELRGLICSGPMQDGKHTYALLDDRAPQSRRLDRAEALAELVLRYFSGHGPATERDLAYWATMTLTDIRAGLAEVGDQLERFAHDGRTYWFSEDAPDAAAPFEPRAHLLQILDEYFRGYQDSRHVLDIAGIVPKGRPANVGMALVDGQMVGGMKRATTTESVAFEVDLFRELDDTERVALEDAADRYGRFLGVEATLSLKEANSTR